MIEPPTLTVVLIVDRQRQRGARCLASILSQNTIEQLEVLLIGLCADMALPGSDHPRVRVLPARRGSIGAIMAEAVRHASAPVVAFLQEHCVAMPGWAEALIAAHQQSCAAVVGQVLNDNPTLGPSRAIYLVNYARFNDPTKRGETQSIVRHNVSYKRDILLRYADHLDFFLFHDPLLIRQLAADGFRVYAEPDARFQHAMETDLTSCWKINFIANRLGAWANSVYFGWSLARKLLYVVASPLLPALRYGRLLWFAATQRPWLLAPTIRYAPYVITIITFAVLGRTVGIIFGKGRSEEQFTFYELNEYRGIDGLDAPKIRSRWI